MHEAFSSSFAIFISNALFGDMERNNNCQQLLLFYIEMELPNRNKCDSRVAANRESLLDIEIMRFVGSFVPFTNGQNNYAEKFETLRLAVWNDRNKSEMRWHCCM